MDCLDAYLYEIDYKCKISMASHYAKNNVNAFYAQNVGKQLNFVLFFIYKFSFIRDIK
jgi:predicted SAM-dependent methyltransferase